MQSVVRSESAPHPVNHPDRTGVLIVIVNYCCAALTVRCLEALHPQVVARDDVRVVVVDNASPDGSAQALQAAIDTHQWSDWVSLSVSPVNGGFASGNNFALRPALTGSRPPEFVWLLNPDTEVRANALSTLESFMRQHPRAGVVGGSYEDNGGVVWPYAFRFPSVLGELDAGMRWGALSRLLVRFVVAQPMEDRNQAVDWLCGANLMIRSKVFERTGLMDDRYFLYFEETDFCLQAARSGWERWYVPACRVMHHGGGSTGFSSDDEHPKRMPGYWFESRRLYFQKNHGWAYAALCDLLWVTGFAIWRIRRILQGKPDRDPPHLLADFLRHSVLWNWKLPVNAKFGEKRNGST